MDVRERLITGDVYEYDNSGLTVFKSEYGNFVFEGDGLEFLSGRVRPHHIDYFGEESCIETNREIPVYVTDEKLFVPSYDADSPEPNKLFVIDGEFVICVGGWVDLKPETLRRDEAQERLREVYTVTLEPWRSRHADPSLVRDTTLQQVFDESDVERVEMV